MPAPTALRRNDEPMVDFNTGTVVQEPEDECILDLDATPAPIQLTADSQPQNLVHIQTRKIPIPPHRFSPIKAEWPKIYPPLCEHLKLQVRMNIKNKSVELRSSRFTTDTGALQKGEDFVRALAYGFDVEDAIALLRLDDLFIESFEIKDVKASLQGGSPGARDWTYCR
ncbi:pre-rRNA-processing protein pno1 [Aspergillus tanneri]|uniref:Pre-rRNA-processing protein pno1 n=1 Tax=Aspergillus tanneri TaxID=1220188 RepID=A0A5M9N550_9EURO|nr:pre-rRNA-processing protein pno1 [Aspergillus tanneri]KAA8652169.1 pre-rRNA-processing protein pno1 [Aspergillus tanneri]